jgi:hypothetical protein
MKKYLITEDQMTRIMLKESTNIKKGLALKVQDENGEFYKSIIKEFKSEDDFNNWKDNLKSNVTLIGDMDIDDDVSETINESTYDKMPKEKKDIGFYMLFKTLKGRYPFIIDIIPKLESLKKYGTLLSFDIVFDLYKFYKFTNTHYHSDYQHKDHLLDLLNDKNHYLFTYTDSVFNDEINKLDYDLRDFMDRYYKTINPNMRYSKFDLWVEEDFRESDNFEFYLKWAEDKDSPTLGISKWIPVVDLDKIKELNIN